MTASNGLRRSKRLQYKETVTYDPKTHARTTIQKTWTTPRTIIQKTRTTPSARARSKKNPSVDLELLEAHLAGHERAWKAMRILTSVEDPQHPSSRFVEDSASEASSDADGEDDSDESGDEYNEDAELSYDCIEYHASHDLQNKPGRRYSTLSYDSRFEPGNDVYEEDDFVVDDDESVEMEDSDATDEDLDGDLDLAINMERNPFPAGYHPTGRAVRASSIFSDHAHRRRSSTVTVSPRTVRQPSLASTQRRRSSSKLFFSDREGDASIPSRLAPWMDLGFSAADEDEEPEQPLIDQASAEVVEEIVDALALFSHRANWNRPPVTLRLAAAALHDREIRDALQDAIRTGLGRKMSLTDGSKRWTFGPRR